MIPKKFLLYMTLSWLSLFFAGYMYAQGSWNIIRQQGTEIYTDAEFVDKNNGWVVGYVPVATIEEENECDLIIHTADGGKTWEYQKYKSGSVPIAIDLVDALHGWILSNKGVILHTEDGGKHWEPDSTLYYPWWEGVDVCFVNMLQGWVIGNNPQRIYSTTDGGQSWNLRYEKQQPERGLARAFFLDSLNGWVVGNEILHTINGGRSWEIIPYQGAQPLIFHNCYFIDSIIGWALARLDHHDYILKTIDGGHSWNVQLDGLSWYLEGVAFVDSLHGWIVGYQVTGVENAAIWYTKDGGENWTSQESGLGEMSSLFSVCFIDSCDGWTIGVAGGERCLGTVLKYTSNPSDIDPNKSDWQISPISFDLLPNYPNPFNTETTIRYYLSKPSHIMISIYNISGQQIINFLNNQLIPSGYHEISWDGKNLKKEIIASGVYFCVLKSDLGVRTRKIIVLGEKY